MMTNNRGAAAVAVRARASDGEDFYTYAQWQAALPQYARAFYVAGDFMR